MSNVGENELTKICTKCGKTKTYSEFNKQKNGKLGLRSYCKKCEHKKDMIV